ncbi:hypothetical protein H4R33_005194 [Dimargaris cristalligena]|uniref:Cytochrome oxidase c subunit VIb-domain-containing protein n=1 Tax=Dimargaris cristalligena TaxID=215637 RepID=A0A4V1J4U0_9FUNG|nr:hypothetical protein H4R33_005194 [Dimargaris cristalligena]RKP36729.1 hypothetical protein BJ085DRAFT_41199 [Dimargaris cristalligena]|eukprot:RKP36729.1 hypothetical protein BJ085DRAFT_41199 [Dimargaris cristalligena]
MSGSSSVPYKQLNRQDRKVCWAARDALFKCLDTNQEELRFMDIPPACDSVYKMFDQQCPPAWTEYFVKKRALEKQAEKRLELMNAELKKTLE